MDWLSGLYPWLKALHILSVIAWMAGLLYLPRLFVYHADAKVGSEQSGDLQDYGATPAARGS
jgi:putative membrane protein